MFSAEKRCKGKHFFSFHQNFFQVFFRGGCQPFIVQRLSLPKAGAKVRTLSDSATHSTHFFSYFFDIRGKYAVKQGFTTETFWKGSREEGKTAHLYIREYAVTFIYAAKHSEISTRKDENFYSERCLSHAVGTGNASACVFWGNKKG